MIVKIGSVTTNFPKPCITEHERTDGFMTIEFPEPFPEGAKVVVIPMVQTFGGCNTPGIRIADVTPKGFKMWANETVVARGKENIALSDGNHRTENVAWVAFAQE